MHISLVISGIGAVVAAVGGGVLLARCLRQPRIDLVAFAIALLGLLISLGSQALGYVAGFDAAMFRAMELGGQVIAPLALILALTEIAAKSTPVRFCARLYIPAVGIVASVVLTLDQLAQTTFSKTWPNPSVFYGTPPNYVLEFAIGPMTALVAIIAVGCVAYRSGQAGWNRFLPVQLMGGGAALLLAYPALAELVAYLANIHLPLSASVFALACTAAAALTWLAGAQAGRLQLASRQSGADGALQAPRAYDGADQAADFRRFEPATDGGVYRNGGLYRPDPAGRARAMGHERDDDNSGFGWPDQRPGDRYRDDWHDDPAAEAGRWDQRDGFDQHGGGYQADFATGDFVPGDYATGDFAVGDVRSDDHEPDAGQWQAGAGSADHLQRYDQQGSRGSRAGADDFGGGDRQAEGGGRSQLFGQIAIYTLLEDRVEEFDQLIQRVVELVRSREPDTLVFIVHAVPSAPMQRILYEVYRDRSAYDWHGQQPHVLQFEADKRPYVLATNVIELGLQQAKVSPFPSVTELFSEPGYDTAGFERPDYLRDYGRASAQPGGATRDYR